jgi:MoaA/NifB/PqqE/SkfB family radical SAM enzyme
LNDIIDWAVDVEDVPNAVTLSGGEPALHQDLDAIVRLISTRLCRRVAIVSNGTLLTAERLEGLASAGLTMLRLGIDRLTPERSRPSPGGTRHALEPSQIVEMALGLGVGVEINTVLTKFNRPNYSRILDFAVDHGVNAKFFELVTVSAFGSRATPGDISSTPHIDADDFTDAVMDRYPGATPTIDAEFGEANLLFDVKSSRLRYCRYLCDYGLCWTSGTRVDPDGTVYVCMAKRESRRIVDGQVGRALRGLPWSCRPTLNLIGT